MKSKYYATRVEPINGLMVLAETLGKHHEFSLCECSITITLPASIQHPKIEKRASLTAYPDHPQFTWFEVFSVDVRVNLNRDINFDGVDADLNSEAVDSSKSADRAFRTALLAIEQALDIWKRTLRWVSDRSGIGFSDIVTPIDKTSGRGIQLRRSSDDHLVINHGGMISSNPRGEVSPEAWAMAGELLRDGIRPPIWMDYLHDACRQKIVGDFRSAVLSGAISCETIMRNLFSATLPPNNTAVANRILDRTNISNLISDWDNIAGWSKAKSKNNGIEEVKLLFRLRNSVMHSGFNDYEALSQINTLYPKIACFVMAGDDRLNELNGKHSVIRTAKIFPDKALD